MTEAHHSPFKLPDEYIEQTKSLRKETACELAEVREKIDNLHQRELRLQAQLSAMDELLESAAVTGTPVQPLIHSANNSESADGQADESPSTNGAARSESEGQLLASSLRLPTDQFRGSFGPLPNDGPSNSRDSTHQFTHRSPRNSPDLARSVDVVVDILRECGAMHYRNIYEKVEAMGVSIVGKDPAAVLLSRFSRDPRILRVGSGTYDIAG